MAKKKTGRPLPPALKQYAFQKGKSGNPEGARKHNPITRALSKLTVDTYREVIELVLTGNIDALQAMINDPKTPAIQVGVATAFARAIKDGDYGVMERIAERIVGKIPDVVTINSTNRNANVNAVVDQNVLREVMKALQSDV